MRNAVLNSYAHWTSYKGIPREEFALDPASVAESSFYEVDFVGDDGIRWTYGFEPSDFYPDAIACLAACRAAGFVIGIAGNQPEEAEAALKRAGAPADFIAWSMDCAQGSRVTRSGPRSSTGAAGAARPLASGLVTLRSQPCFGASCSPPRFTSAVTSIRNSPTLGSTDALAAGWSAILGWFAQVTLFSSHSACTS